MAYIESKIECAVCKGKGEFHPIGTFDRAEKKPQECINCHGKGFFIHKILVNPVSEIQKEENKEIKNEIKKVNSSKKCEESK